MLLVISKKTSSDASALANAEAIREGNQNRLPVFLFMAIFSQTFFSFVGSYLMSFSFFATRHISHLLAINLVDYTFYVFYFKI
jgi:hypothetical protein